MPIEITSKVSRSSKLEADFNRLIRSVRDIRPIAKTWLDSYYDKEDEVFKNKGKRKGSKGRAWKPLTKATIRMKEKKFVRGEIPGAHIKRVNLATGRLMRSLTQRLMDNVYEVNKSGGHFGTAVKYSKAIQKGKRKSAKRPRRGRPARSLLKLTAADRDQFLESLAAFVASGGGGDFILKKGRISIIKKKQQRGLDL